MTLSLCMIVKNEEDVLARILSMAKIFCDEIIIVDTGSEDNTIAVAEKFTDKIYTTPFVDFSSARNYSLSKATCDYVMWLDADDFISEKNSLEFLNLKNSLVDEDMIMCPYVTAFDEADKPVFSYYRERIFKNESGFRFEGKVHEAVCPKGKVVLKDIAVEHRKTKPAAPLRNLNIYQKSISDGEILSTRDLYYYANELYYNNMYSQALATYEEYGARKDFFTADKIQSLINSSNILISQRRFDKALEKISATYAYTLPTPTILCQIGYVLQQWGKYELSDYFYLAALQAKENNVFSFVNSDYQAYIPYVQLGFNNYLSGNIDMAIYYTSQALAVKPYGKVALENNAYYLNRKIFSKKSACRE